MPERKLNKEPPPAFLEADYMEVSSVGPSTEGGVRTVLCDLCF